MARKSKAAKLDPTIAEELWNRYIYMRDYGHSDFVTKATKCDQFFTGNQWDPKDRSALREARRPALTINKILSTISTLMGDQIQNRTEISFRPKRNAMDETTKGLVKLFKHISDDNQLDWLRSDVFADGVITSRGFYDVRLGFTDNLQGEVKIALLNPKNVLIDPDSDSYDPDDWKDVITTKWWSMIEIENTYGKDVAEMLKTRLQYYEGRDPDSVESQRDRFGTPAARGWSQGRSQPQSRLIRVIERQYKEVDVQEHFVDLTTGDIRPIPASWDRNRIAHVVDEWKFAVVELPRERIKWRAAADQVILHDEWSPYKHFTVVPYFPHFRRGRTVGLVENLIDPQELLNKVSSQELHVVNTTANSGYKVKTGTLVNMTIAELETRGAETGLVMEVNDIDGVQKIEPNQYPTGLDRISFKAEEHIKTISMVTDTMMGNDREDVAAKAITAKQSRSAAVHAKPLDNLARTDYLLARNVLDIVQEYYTEHRVYNIITDDLTGESEEVQFNAYDEVSDTIVNDLTLGEYQVIVTTTPAREAFEDSQFEQAVQLRELLGPDIPSEVLIKNSRLLDRGDIISKMQEAAQSPDAQARQQAEMAMLQAQVAQAQADVAKTQADAESKVAKAEAQVADMKRKLAETSHKISTDTPEVRRQESEQAMALQREKHEQDLQMQREKHGMDMQSRMAESAADMQQRRDEHAMSMAQAHDNHVIGLQQRQEAHESALTQNREKAGKTSDNDGDE